MLLELRNLSDVSTHTNYLIQTVKEHAGARPAETDNYEATLPVSSILSVSRLRRFWCPPRSRGANYTAGRPTVNRNFSGIFTGAGHHPAPGPGPCENRTPPSRVPSGGSCERIQLRQAAGQDLHLPRASTRPIAPGRPGATRTIYMPVCHSLTGPRQHAEPNKRRHSPGLPR
jgi:hypothetical protein